MLTKLKKSFKKLLEKIKEKINVIEENLIELKNIELVVDLNTILKNAIKVASVIAVFKTAIICIDFVLESILDIAYKVSSIAILLGI